MAAVRTLMILLGALAVLGLGATPMAAMAEAPPCHAQSHSTGHGAPADQPASKALKVMNCCVACVTAPRIDPPALSATPRPGEAVRAAPSPALSGLHPSPAHGPPRT